MSEGQLVGRAPWTYGSREILRKTADIVDPSNDLDALTQGSMLELV